ncbi:FERM, ARHGEF and pleckstrin domain-containing protein 1-like [Amphibalanus amphitrite]|uniref:FERM, ARHGEF and pleckstrin domain-containing protein 1-like n=1 Tax=Amphibalanus amphitrite TaxID=1232801 RepID=UPI001C9285B4|nr:FERM, ARHGEF and pleckstrin domain-containing protein 1-like [Amphibalanus amphitrite]XP_043222147.1 FERM, ARHGEF and pleckstrin domain-containing protein 1-like [Amphibalanus amphitrite]
MSLHGEPPPPPPPAPGSAGRERTPPATPGSSKLMTARVLLLDDLVVPFHIQLKSPGRTLFDMVCKHLNLLETDYFGLEYVDTQGVKYWLDLERPMGRQVDLAPHQPILWFCVKFYTPDPAQLEDEFTRYLFALQVKRDLAQGHLQCNDNTAALMASYICQAEYGDFSGHESADASYLRACRVMPGQDADMERRIMESHRRLVGQTPAEADLNLLETARRCELYGMKMHPAKDHEGVPLNLAVAHMGIVVFQNYYKISTFSWAKIRKLSFKRRRFLIKLHPEGHGYYKDTVEFFFGTRNYCKNFWKKCVEHHGFFRCLDVAQKSRSKPRVLPRGSSFRFSGRTQKQMIEYVRENYAKHQGFNRSQSFRSSSALRGTTSLAGSTVGPSLSAHPLIPAELPADRSTVGTPVSLSYGSVTLPSSTAPQSPQSGTERDTAELDTSRGEASGSLASSPPQYAAPPPPPALPDDGTLPVLSVNEGGSEPDEPPPPPPPPPPPATVSPPPPPLPEPRLNGTGTAPLPVENGQPAPPEIRRKPRRIPADRAFFIAKEMLSTERTYRTDLRILHVWFREAVEAQPGVPIGLLSQLFVRLEPIYTVHSQLLRDLEQRLIAWEQSSPADGLSPPPRLCDVLLQANLSDVYLPYIDCYLQALETIEREYRTNETFKQMYRDFEMQKVCYLPVAALVLKPLQRVLHLHTLLTKLAPQYKPGERDAGEAAALLQELSQLTERLQPRLLISDNRVKLMELQRDLVGCDALLAGAEAVGRRFVREGCLQKLSKKGYQHRMFFLFSDVLVYTSRTTSPVPQFKVHGQLPLRGVSVEQTDSQLGIANCFTIFGGNRALVIAASCAEERDAWLRDLRTSIESAMAQPDTTAPLSSSLLPACSSSDEIMCGLSAEDGGTPLGAPSERQPNWRSNRSPHVCWHRGISVSMAHTAAAVHGQLSGYLLRKFKNSDGWQKLWVVLTNFCLYFYKTFQDECPLTSLPLLGYVVSEPAATDNIHKEHVFKLQFKQHIYFFRAESRYTLERWLEVIGRTASTYQ